MNNEGMIKDMRKNEYYEKPSAKKRREKQQATQTLVKITRKTKRKLLKCSGVKILKIYSFGVQLIILMIQPWSI